MLTALRDLFFLPAEGGNMKATNTMESYAASVSTQTGVSPAIIAAIIAMISQLIGACPKPPTPAQVLSPTGFWENFVLNKSVREAAGIRPRSEEGKKLIGVMQAEAAHISEADAATFITMSTMQS